MGNEKQNEEELKRTSKDGHLTKEDWLMNHPIF